MKCEKHGIEMVDVMDGTAIEYHCPVCENWHRACEHGVTSGDDCRLCQIAALKAENERLRGKLAIADKALDVLAAKLANFKRLELACPPGDYVCTCAECVTCKITESKKIKCWKAFALREAERGM